MNVTLEIYQTLLSNHGPQGWWPLYSRREAGCYDKDGYHPKVYQEPQNREGRWEVILGAILTQNTSWTNVEKSFVNILQAGLLDSDKLPLLDPGELEGIIRPSGYFNQKAKKIRYAYDFFTQSNWTCPSREALLGVWGIGPETADSILLYAFHQRQFVVDAYTHRIMNRLEVGPSGSDYHQMKGYFEDSLPSSVEIYQEYHALIVAHAKAYCRKRDPLCTECPLNSSCPSGKGLVLD